MEELWRDFNIFPRRLGFVVKAAEDHWLGECCLLCVFAWNGLENHRAPHLHPLLASSWRFASGSSGRRQELERESGVRSHVPYFCLLPSTISLQPIHLAFIPEDSNVPIYLGITDIYCLRATFSFSLVN